MHMQQIISQNKQQHWLLNQCFLISILKPKKKIDPAKYIFLKKKYQIFSWSNIFSAMNTLKIQIQEVSTYEVKN